MALPPGNFGGVQFQPYAPYGTFSASGLNLGFIQMNYQMDFHDVSVNGGIRRPEAKRSFEHPVR